MSGEDLAGSPEWSWNAAAWDECHGVEREVRAREGVWCAALQRGAACESAMFLRDTFCVLNGYDHGAPPQDV